MEKQNFFKKIQDLYSNKRIDLVIESLIEKINNIQNNEKREYKIHLAIAYLNNNEINSCLQTLKEIDPKLNVNIDDIDIYKISNTNNIKEYFINCKKLIESSTYQYSNFFNDKININSPLFLINQHNVKIMGNSFLPAVEHKKIFHYGLIKNVHEFIFNNKTNVFGCILLLGSNNILVKKNNIKNYQGEYVLIGNHKNFGHWLFNHLSRLILVKNLIDKESVKFIFSEDLDDKQVEALNFFGISENRILKIDNDCIANFENLWIPSMPYCVIKGELCWDKRILFFLKNNFLKNINKAPTKKVYLTRGNAKHRKVLNENEIINLLKKNNFSIVDPSKLSIAEQIEIASETKVLITPIGAGNNFGLFSPENLVFIELKHENIEFMDIHKVVCQILKQNYIEVKGKRVGNYEKYPENYNFIIDDDYNIPINKIKKIIETT